jgi:hypothetical protein
VRSSNGAYGSWRGASKVTCDFVADRGKGSHGRLYFGGESTTLKDRKKEIGRDLFSKMCRDLGIDPQEL